MISTKSVEDKKEFVSPFVKPGIGEYRVAHMEYVEPEIGSPHIAMYIESRPLEALNGEPQKATFTEYVTEKAKPYTLRKIQDIAEAAGTPKEEMDKIEAPTWDEFVALVSPKIVGKFLRFKFGGDEILSKGKGTTWFKATMPAFRFVEPITDVVGLKYDESKDLNRLPEADIEDNLPETSGAPDMGTSSDNGDDDMPF